MCFTHRFQIYSIYIHVNKFLHLYTLRQRLSHPSCSAHSCPGACLCEENVFSSNQSDVAHSNLSILRMSLFAIFLQLRPNILYHSTAELASASVHTHIHLLSHYTSMLARYPTEGLSHVYLSDRSWESSWLGQEVMCVKFTLFLFLPPPSFYTWWKVMSICVCAAHIYRNHN